MNRNDLERELASRGADPRAFSLTGGHADDRYCLDQLPHGRWRTYFSEGGRERVKQEFETEALACDHFLNWISLDPTAFQEGTAE